MKSCNSARSKFMDVWFAAFGFWRLPCDNAVTDVRPHDYAWNISCSKSGVKGLESDNGACMA